MNVTVAECERDPLTPVIVTVVICAVENVQDSTAVPVPVMLVVLSEQATLFADRATTPVKPSRPVTAIVDVPATPAFTLTVVGLALIVKSCAVTVDVPLLPV